MKRFFGDVGVGVSTILIVGLLTVGWNFLSGGGLIKLLGGHTNAELVAASEIAKPFLTMSKTRQFSLSEIECIEFGKNALEKLGYLNTHVSSAFVFGNFSIIGRSDGQVGIDCTKQNDDAENLVVSISLAGFGGQSEVDKANLIRNYFHEKLQPSQ